MAKQDVRRRAGGQIAIRWAADAALDSKTESASPRAATARVVDIAPAGNNSFGTGGGSPANALGAFPQNITSGNDILVGSTPDEIINGGSGNDIIEGRGGNDIKTGHGPIS